MSLIDLDVLDSNSFSEQAGKSLQRSLLVWRACLTILHVLAILSAIYRLYRRGKTRQVWRDDYFAAIALILECLYFPTLWLTEDVRREAQVVSSWIAQTVCPLVIWFTRVSLALTTARVIPPKHSMRLTSICFAWICGLIGIAVAIGSLITCGRHHSTWDKTYPYQCPMPLASAILRSCMDIVSDIILVAIPFWAFWRRLKLPKMSCRLIKACFAASLLTFVSCIATAAVLFGRHNAKSPEQKAETGFLASVMSQLMASTSLLVCNMLVVVTSVYRYFRAEGTIIAIGNVQPLPPESTASRTTESGSNTNNEQSAMPIATVFENSRALARSLATISSMETSRVELTEIFESDFSLPAVAYIERTSGEKSRSRGDDIDVEKFG